MEQDGLKSPIAVLITPPETGTAVVRSRRGLSRGSKVKLRSYLIKSQISEKHRNLEFATLTRDDRPWADAALWSACISSCSFVVKNISPANQPSPSSLFHHNTIQFCPPLPLLQQHILPPRLTYLRPITHTNCINTVPRTPAQESVSRLT